jgi:hypothetical protein
MSQTDSHNILNGPLPTHPPIRHLFVAKASTQSTIMYSQLLERVDCTSDPSFVKLKTWRHSTPAPFTNDAGVKDKETIIKGMDSGRKDLPDEASVGYQRSLSV